MCRREEKVVPSCNLKENEELINAILEADSKNKRYEPKPVALKLYKRTVLWLFEKDRSGKREIDKILNVSNGQSKKNVKQLIAMYDKNPDLILKHHWTKQLCSLFLSHDLLRDIIAGMITLEKEVREDERKESDA